MPRDTVVVLVVEDVPQVRATAVRIMEDLGCEVFDAYNGRDALKLLRAHPDIEVLFADVRMPGMSGTELARGSASAATRSADRAHLWPCNPNDVPACFRFVPKPWRTRDIAEAVIQSH